MEQWNIVKTPPETKVSHKEDKDNGLENQPSSETSLQKTWSNQSWAPWASQGEAV
jgi:hypothetical protein